MHTYIHAHRYISLPYISSYHITDVHSYLHPCFAYIRAYIYTWIHDVTLQVCLLAYIHASHSLMRNITWQIIQTYFHISQIYIPTYVTKHAIHINLIACHHIHTLSAYTHPYKHFTSHYSTVHYFTSSCTCEHTSHIHTYMHTICTHT